MQSVSETSPDVGDAFFLRELGAFYKRGILR